MSRETPPAPHLQGEGTVNKSRFCFPPNAVATSAGVFAGDDPLKFYFPLLLYHVCAVFALSRGVHALLSRANVPLVISQIVRVHTTGRRAARAVAPRPGAPARQRALRHAGGVGAAQHGGRVRLRAADLRHRREDGPGHDRQVREEGRGHRLLRHRGAAPGHVRRRRRGRAHVPAPWKANFMLTNLNVWWSLSAFIVVCTTLGDLNLLSSKLGRLAMSAALIGDFANTFSIAGITSYLLASSPSEKVQRIGFLSLLTSAIFIGFLAFVARPAILRLMRDVPEGGLLCEARLVAVLLTTIVCSFAGEIIGLHATYGPFMLGLMLPGGAPLGVTLGERLDRLVAGVLMPLLFAQGGLRLDVFKIADASICLLLQFFLVVGVAAKQVSCMLPCLYCGMPLREAFILGLMMNFKGITEVAYASAFMDSDVFDEQVYAAFMLNVLLLGAATASVVKHMYHPEEKYVAYRRRTVQHKKLGDELRVLVCVHSQADVAPMLALLDAASASPVSPVAVYLLHLAPLVGLTSSVLRAFKHGDRNCVPSGGTDSERIVNAFQYFVQQRPVGSASLLPYVCIAPYATMHDDACAVALEKRAMLIVVPFHQRLAIDGSVENTTASAGSVQAANVNVLNYSPCSVAILVDRGSLSVVPAGAATDGFPHRIALYFLGGPDDREALALATYMAEDAPIGLTVFRFLPPPEWRKGGDPEEDRLDEEALQEYVSLWVDDHRVAYSENLVCGSDEMVGIIRKSSPASDLLIVGRRADGPKSPLTVGISDWSEHLELGVLGDLLTSTDFGCQVSTLVVQQQTRAAAGEISRSPQKNTEKPPESDGHV
ncbi:unnamed protein product [Miscanthus lutarioriparius]|uniref:Cation/H+ exchanger domain-containing protein n=1 Tax=Miscanthus lutarioriparius TaxID=422564 RepID=A0A811SK11_9POAL|nr:unnamed protein product [Miscanthus lutarioriparius]